MTMIALGRRHRRGSVRRQRRGHPGGRTAAVSHSCMTGLLVVLVMRMLGEMAVALPAVGSFYEYSRLAWSDRPRLGELAGFLTGWMYWYFWVIVVALEAVAGAGADSFWFPNEPAVGHQAGDDAVLTLTNLFSVQVVGRGRVLVRARSRWRRSRCFLFWRAAYVLGLWPGSRPGVAQSLGARRVRPERHPADTHRCGSGHRLLLRRRDRHGRGRGSGRAGQGRGAGDPLGDLARPVFLRRLDPLVVCLVPWNSADMAHPYVSALSAMAFPPQRR